MWNFKSGGLAALALAAWPMFGLPANAASLTQPALQPGDTWIYEQANQRGTNPVVARRVDLTIERLNGETMLVGIKPDGAAANYQDHISGLDWSQRRLVGGLETVTGRPLAFPIAVGKTWTADYVEPRQSGRQTFAHFHTTYKVVGWEDVVVPAGTFHALKVEANGSAEAAMAPAVSTVRGAIVTPRGAAAVARVTRSPAGVLHVVTYGEFFYAPEVKYFVKSLEEQYNGENVLLFRNTQSLVSFQPQPAS